MIVLIFQINKEPAELDFYYNFVIAYINLTIDE